MDDHPSSADMIELKEAIRLLSEDVRTVRHSTREIKQAIVGNAEFGLIGLRDEMKHLGERITKLDTDFQSFKTMNGAWQHKVELKVAAIAGGISVLAYMADKLFF